MPIATVTRRFAAVLLLALGLSCALLLPATPAGAVAGSDRLVLNWEADGARLNVVGAGYRARDLVEVRLGSSPIQQARGDENGRIEVTVPETLLAAGTSGSSIVISGRSVSGTSRILISAVPPKAAAHGPSDVLPWTVGAGTLVILLAGFWLRRRAGSPAATAPRGYRRRHAA
ncbi:hypothetical protein [Actinoplanes derwentensis]|uniref:MYXO-CTERM domain-containing protein n=1 Tax=Actinoplanes derwentensis TaxID=113562 RepID=A0A1H2ALT0_9ACTN|nr:hypothetical protein [Actinoplanes derwentensis]GID88809.1 hypothetical protein Ade03nite_77330 [Actinoplanes derwentensis]SDT46732.1 hypothetical protein SAMN04489716_3937 [Actinoplanes derwentensis]